MSAVILAASEVAPIEGMIGAIAVTTTSQAILISGNAALAAAQSRLAFVTFQADSATYYWKFAATNANVVDETATSGLTQCASIPANEARRVRIPKGVNYLIVKSSTAGQLRFYESSSMALA